MARLTDTNGNAVSVDDAKVDGLVARGFKKAEKPAPKKATPSNDDK